MSARLFAIVADVYPAVVHGLIGVVIGVYISQRRNRGRRRITYDRAAKALYVSIEDGYVGCVASTRELDGVTVKADMTTRGHLSGLELLGIDFATTDIPAP